LEKADLSRSGRGGRSREKKPKIKRVRADWGRFDPRGWGRGGGGARAPGMLFFGPRQSNSWGERGRFLA